MFGEYADSTKEIEAFVANRNHFLKRILVFLLVLFCVFITPIPPRGVLHIIFNAWTTTGTKKIMNSKNCVIVTTNVPSLQVS